MERLSPLDAAFLAIEDEDPHASLAIASLAIAAGPAPSQEEFAAAVTAGLPRIPRYRQKVRRVPLDLGAPAWVDDDAFDLTAHVRRLSVPAPHDEAALSELVALLMAERLDRERPLWQLCVLEGLPDGRWAVLSKVHHCLADGISAAGVQQLLFAGTAPSAPAAAAEPDPGALRLLKSALGDLVTGPFSQLGAVAGSLWHPRALARRVTDIAHGLATLAEALMPVAPSSLGGPISGPRGYAVSSVPLADVAAVAAAFDVTVNDVLLAAVTGGFREILMRRGEEPAPDSVRTLVPVSVRLGGDAVGNEVSLLLPLLPVDLPDPAQRLVRVHRHLRACKTGKEATAGKFVVATAARGPFAPAAWALRAALRLPQHNVVTVTTNVPGPAEPLAMAGREVLALYPYVPIALRLRTGVAMLTYRDRVFVGVTADAGLAADAQVLADSVVSGVAALTAAATSSSSAATRPAGSGSNRRSVPNPNRT
ncbi:wax ester/triacylglycerol synthase family O-acyltransferase [Amycolatopsis nivea]